MPLRFKDLRFEVAADVARISSQVLVGPSNTTVLFYKHTLIPGTAWSEHWRVRGPYSMSAYSSWSEGRLTLQEKWNLEPLDIEVLLYAMQLEERDRERTEDQPKGGKPGCSVREGRGAIIVHADPREAPDLTEWLDATDRGD